MRHWAALEADFDREYRADLYRFCRTRTWRAFMARVSNLSPNSAFVNRMESDRRGGTARPDREMVHDPDEAEAILTSWAGG